jgi:hypothetical protein
MTVAKKIDTIFLGLIHVDPRMMVTRRETYNKQDVLVGYECGDSSAS